MPKSMPGPGLGGADAGTPLQLPALQSLIVTGDLEPMLSVQITGGAADPAGATNLADVVRGFVALASLQAGSNPELKQLASAISVTTNASEVQINARIPYEV